jgi:hypothetical protein
MERSPTNLAPPYQKGESKDVVRDDFIEVKKELLLGPGKGLMMGIPKKVSGLPPTIDTTTNFTHVYRFKSGVGTSVNVATGDLFACAGCVASSSTNAYAFCSSVRIRRITVWLSPSSTASQSAAIIWVVNSGAIGEKDTFKLKSLPEGITVTDSVTFRPPPKTFGDLWFASSSNLTDIIFQLTTPSGSIVDVELDLTIGNSLSGNVQANTGSGMTPGVVYYGGLDSFVSTNYVPLGLAAG